MTDPTPSGMRPDEIRSHSAVHKGGREKLNGRDKWIFRATAAWCCEWGEDHGKTTAPGP